MTREEAKEFIAQSVKSDVDMAKVADALKALEQEPKTFKWCTDCKEYDQEKHCCHRWSKVIRNTVDEMKQEYIERLDKIRTEIEQITDTMGVSYNQYVSKIDVLHILDKYKAEQEKT